MTRKRRTPGRVAKVSELKAGLSAYLERVKRGEQVIVTERGEAIARIIPVATGRTPSDQWARVREMERQGRVIVRGEGRVPEEYWTLQIPDLPQGSLVRALLEDRDESW